MKQSVFILLIFILVSCTYSYKKSNLIGTWECISSKNKVTNEVLYPNGEEDVLVAVFSLDSLYLNDELDEVHTWQLKGDSIFIGNYGAVYIKELTANSLIVELHFFDEIEMTFNKVK